MKTWLFALLQSLIAVLGVVAYFWADNLVLATSAAVAAACLGILQPLLSAHRERRLEAYQDRQFQKSFDAVDGQLRTLLDQSIDPPLPHRPTLAALLGRQEEQRAAERLDRYDRAAAAVTAHSAQAARLVSEFSAHAPRCVAAYLEGLAAFAAGNREAACRHFIAAKQAHPAWVSPWLGWAATLYALGRTDEIRREHPHICGVELLPYDAGDEQTFLELSEHERQELSDLFQQTATSLGNYYAIAEICRSKSQLAASREELRKAG